jgi:hypothetical protein
MCFGHICNFIDKSGNEYFMGFSGIYKSTADSILLIEKTAPVPILLIIIVVLSLFAIMLFKKRKLQLSITISVIALSVCFACSIVWFSVSVAKTYDAEFIMGLKASLPLLIIVFSLLSYRGIKKDEDLVKSYERLR